MLSCRVFGAAVGFHFVFHGWDGLVLFEDNARSLRCKKRIEDNVLLDDALGGFVDVLAPFKQDAIPVQEVEHVGSCIGMTEALDLCNDHIGHRHHRDLASLDLLAGAKVKYFIGSLYVSHWAKDDRRSRARDHRVQGGGLIMGFAVGTKACLAVSLEIELLSENDFPGQECPTLLIL